MGGRDFGSLLVDDTHPFAVLAEIDQKKMVALGTQKLIHDFATDSSELYDLASDPGEKRRLWDGARTAELLAAMQALGRVTARKNPALERARQGDRSVFADLVELCEKKSADCDEAMVLMAELPADPALRARLEALTGPVKIDIALCKLGDRSARARLQAHIGEVCAADAVLCAHAALALADAPWLGRALDAELPEALRSEVIAALGRSHDARAFEPLYQELGQVRTRGQVVDALGELGDPRALEVFLRWIGEDSYVHVRQKMARAIGQLGRGDARAHKLLARLAKEDDDTAVRQACSEALALTQSK
jgi:HEAT repeat protein